MSIINLSDLEHHIIQVKWFPTATPEEIAQVTADIASVIQGNQWSYFYLLVDMRAVKAFAPPSQLALVEHQKELISLGMRRATVVVDSAIAKSQLRRSARQADNEVESHWDNEEEALQFLRAQPSALN